MSPLKIIFTPLRVAMEASGIIAYLDRRYVKTKQEHFDQNIFSALYDVALIEQSKRLESTIEDPWLSMLRSQSIDFTLSKNVLESFSHIEKVLSPIPIHTIENEKWSEGSAFLTWGNMLKGTNNPKALAITANMLEKYKPLYIAEDGFVRSISSFAAKNVDLKYKKSSSLSLDDLNPYYDGFHASRMEQMIKDYKVTDNEREEAEALIEKLVKNYISKYNDQPILDLTKKMPEGVLVIDQVYNDFSVLKGGGKENLRKMLKTAIAENPDKKVYIKIHPDNVSIGNDHGGFYGSLLEHKNIEIIDYACNPFSLLINATEVYVFSSQLGLEALFLGKKVHVFGLPFYSGWGLTDDRHPYASSKSFRSRRGVDRSMLDVFHIAYCVYTRYIDEMGNLTQLDNVIDSLIKKRRAYFKQYDVKDEMNVT
jgi:capsule polysaccharide export protein KpsC/LpsZ